LINQTKLISALFLSVSTACFAASAGLAQDTLKGGVGENTYNSGTTGTSYPAPQMMKAAPAPVMQHMPAQKPMQAKATHTAPLEISATKSVTLPPGFLGRWTVHATRKSVEALPEFQAGAENAFATSTTAIWNITGDPQRGYTIVSDSGINTQFYVDKVGKGTAIIRYQHPVKNTNAQESVILTGGGNSFEGLERISIVKQGQPPRAKVEYTLNGSR
jgi:hypothetical protein